MNHTADITNEELRQFACERESICEWLNGLLSDQGSHEVILDSQGRLQSLSQTFGLSEFELQFVGVLWACTFDPDLRHRLLSTDYVTPILSSFVISKLLAPNPVVRLNPSSPLLVWELVIEREFPDGSASVNLDPQIVAWLEGQHQIDSMLHGATKVLRPLFTLPEWPIEKYKIEILALLDDERDCNVYLNSDDQILMESFVSALTKEMGMFSCLYSLEHIPEEIRPIFLKRSFRQSFLDTTVPVFSAGCLAKILVSSESRFPLKFICGNSVSIEPLENTVNIGISFKELNKEQRQSIWKCALGDESTWSEADFEELAWRSFLNSTDIYRCCASRPSSVSEVTSILKSHSEGDLDRLVHKIESPYRFEDLIVSSEIHDRLQEIVFEAKQRNTVWEQQRAADLFPYGRGLIALMSGEPGTGKTMAAQVIANELGMELLRIDMSAVVSKWIGETAENIQKILSSKVAKRAVLFFDEAEGIYGKRISDIKGSNDRYANMDSGHLMVALENFDGIVLMATNLLANIDPAFLRRVRHTIKFVRPNYEARCAIWKNSIRSLFEEASIPDSGLEKLAKIDATGAQIKNAALSSVFECQRIKTAPSIETLGRLVCRELSKDGRSISANELNDILDDEVMP